MFRKLKTDSAVNRLIEEKLFERAHDELERGHLRKGLWAKALSETECNQQAAESKYLALRVQSLRDDILLIDEITRSFNDKNTENEKKIKEKKSIEPEIEIMPEKKKGTINNKSSINDVSIIEYYIWGFFLILIFTVMVFANN